MQIVTATQDHVPALVVLTDNRQAEDKRDYVLQIPVDHNACALTLGRAVSLGYTFVALNDEQQVIGALVLVPSSDWWNPQAAFLTDILFHAPSQYRGECMTKLLDCAKSVADEARLPLRVTSLHVRSSERMNRYYEERGLSAVGGAWQYLPDVFEQYLSMEKEAAA